MSEREDMERRYAHAMALQREMEAAFGYAMVAILGTALMGGLIAYCMWLATL